MSKFEELKEVVSNARKSNGEYRIECYNFVDFSIKKFMSYLECPTGRIKYYPPLGKENREDSNPHKFLCCQLEDDTFYHLRAGLILEEISGKPYNTAILGFKVKIMDEKFILKINEEHEGKFSSNYKEESFTDLFNSLFKDIKDKYQNGSIKFLNEGESYTAEIGFKV